VAITRAQIPEQIDAFQEGGGAETDSYSELYKELSDRLGSDYDTNYSKYLQRLSQYAPQQPKMSIFEVASELGRGLLSTPNTGVGSTFQGLGAGFDNISQKLQNDKKLYEDRNREIQMMATQLAMQDEQKANDFLNEIALERINAANKKVDYILLEYQEGEETKRVRLPDTNQYANEINDIIQNKGGRPIVPATTEINLPGGEQPGDKRAIEQIFKDQESFGEKAEASNSTIDQVEQARILAEEIGPEDFGPFSRSTLYIREFVDGLGFGDLLESADVIPAQKALNQLSMSFTMGIVSQTKGAISDREMKLFIQASPTLGSTYEGYLKQLELLERLASRDRDFYRQYLEEYKRMIDEKVNPQTMQAELEIFATDWKKNNPLLSREETKELEDIVASGQGLDADFNRDQFEESINRRKDEQARKRVSGIEGVPDGSTLIAEIGGVKYYLKPGGNTENPDDIIKVE
jgi:hypothetical protein